jgi:AraC family ethanolamine operon transcriptional activator
MTNTRIASKEKRKIFSDGAARAAAVADEQGVAATFSEIDRDDFSPRADGARIEQHVSDDPNTQADAIAGWTQQYDQLSTGSFSGSLTEWRTNDLHFFSETTSQALRQACRVRPGAIWFGIPDSRPIANDERRGAGRRRSVAHSDAMSSSPSLTAGGDADVNAAMHGGLREDEESGDTSDSIDLDAGEHALGAHDASTASELTLPASMKIGARTVEADMLACQPGDRDFELVTPSQFRIFGIVITSEAWHDFMQQEYGCAEAPSSLNGDLVRFDAVALNALREVMYRVLCNAGNAGAGRSLSSFQTAHFQDEVLRLLAGGLKQAGDVAPVPALSKPHRRWLVDTARQYVLTHRDRPIGIPELCSVLRASRRTLQYCFQDIYGMSPQRYLRATRLNGVRRALLSPSAVLGGAAGTMSADRGSHRAGPASVGRQTVQEIAAEWGFWHHSQFTADYRQLFSMTPSETLRRGISARD